MNASETLVTAIPAPSFWVILAVVAGVWLLPTVAAVAWVMADRWLDNRRDTEALEVDPHGDLTLQQMCVECWEAEL